MMERARFSMAVSSAGAMRLPQKTWKPECLHVESMTIISFVIFPLARSILSTLCGKTPPAFQLQGRGDAEHASVAIKTAVRDEDVAVRMEAEEVPEGLHGDDGAGDGITFRNRLLKKDLQGFPGTAAEIGKKLPVVEEVTAEDLRDAEYEMPMGNLLEDIHAKPFPELHHPLLMT